MRAAILASVLLITACPGNQPEDSAQHAPAKTSTSTQNPQSVPENSATMNPTTPPTKELPGSGIPGATIPSVPVQLTEYEIRMPDTLPPGQQTLQINNGGKLTHNIAIEGNGLGGKLSSDLSRGNTASITVNLKPGTYTVYCPVDGHRGKGMQRTVTVK